MIIYIINTIIILMLTSAFMTVWSHNSIYAAFYLCVSFILAAGFLLLFNFEFVALILIIVYVGAIAVLFLFVIYMIDVKLQSLNFSNFFYFYCLFFSLFSFLELFVLLFKHFCTNPYLKEQIYFNAVFYSNWILENDTLFDLNLIGQYLSANLAIHLLLTGLILFLGVLGSISIIFLFYPGRLLPILDKIFQGAILSSSKDWYIPDIDFIFKILWWYTLSYSLEIILLLCLLVYLYIIFNVSNQSERFSATFMVNIVLIVLIINTIIVMILHYKYKAFSKEASSACVTCSGVICLIIYSLAIYIIFFHEDPVNLSELFLRIAKLSWVQYIYKSNLIQSLEKEVMKFLDSHPQIREAYRLRNEPFNPILKKALLLLKRNIIKKIFLIIYVILISYISFNIFSRITLRIF